MPDGIGLGGIKQLSRLQSLAEGEAVAGIQSIIAEEAVQTAMHAVGARLGDNVNRGAAGPAQFSRVIAAVDLKFLYRILAQVGTYPAAVVIGFASIHRHIVAPAIASIEGETALRRLLNPEILVAGQPGRVGNARHKQGESKVIAAIDGQVCDVLLINAVGLAAARG